MIKRVDPAGCRCTDCLTGESKPVDWLSDEDKDRIADDLVFDATGMTEQDWDRIL